ncbi:MAG TPA: hypothetical protein VIQ27_16615 [Gemmatimonadales bacterium]
MIEFIAGISTGSAIIAVGYWIKLKRRNDWPEPDYPALIQSERPKIECGHVDLIPVESGGETVAYLCSKCNEQVNLDHRAVAAHRKRLADKELRARADREFSQLFAQPSLAEQIQEQVELSRAVNAKAAEQLGLLSKGATNYIVNDR